MSRQKLRIVAIFCVHRPIVCRLPKGERSELIGGTEIRLFCINVPQRERVSGLFWGSVKIRDQRNSVLFFLSRKVLSRILSRKTLSWEFSSLRKSLVTWCFMKWRYKCAANRGTISSTRNKIRPVSHREYIYLRNFSRFVSPERSCDETGGIHDDALVCDSSQ